MTTLSTSTVPCHVCGQPFHPSLAQFNAWGNSGADFDPTDWECEACLQAEYEQLQAYEAAWLEDDLTGEDPYMVGHANLASYAADFRCPPQRLIVF